ncbi:DUF7144 family membrane protein [Nocardioides bruguierae]|uniref:DUF7144 family membrane protein n=1 Tax=Nocardioides bruguierae TaxID=2945102 RepID=UPI0020214B60|nr:hypothetical protein [Nocardioides bruguierae]MCL8026425.1 hypothetical protein [Nocardioides bruguierae]
MPRKPRPTLWVGPIAFAAVMIAVAGLFNVLTGLTAIATDDVYVTGSRALLVLDVTAWGWVHLVTGVLLLATGVMTLAGRLWARLAALALVVLNLLTQLVLLPATPYASMVTIALEVVVVWAILVHGEELENL